jgi:ferredoxin
MIGADAASFDKIFTVDIDDCIRCAACSSIAPAIFRVAESGAYVIRQPIDRIELAQCETAVVNCPTSSIKVSSR